MVPLWQSGLLRLVRAGIATKGRKLIGLIGEQSSFSAAQDFVSDKILQAPSPSLRLGLSHEIERLKSDPQQFERGRHLGRRGLYAHPGLAESCYQLCSVPLHGHPSKRIACDNGMKQQCELLVDQRYIAIVRAR
jgi:hypothetical protein